MASWVTTLVASEIWKMPVADIIARASRGELQTREEGSFTFVDIDSANIAEAPHTARLSPPTFSIVTREEEKALHESMSIADARKLISQTRKRPVAA